MKVLAFVALWLSMSAMLCASELRDVPSTITRVTVYRQGALVERSLKVQLHKGRTDLYITGLSPKIDEKSIRATATNAGITIVSVGYAVDYLHPQGVTAEIEQLRAQLRQMADSSAMTAKLNSVYQRELDMIVANKSLGGTAGVSTEQLKTTADFFRERLSEIETHLHRNTIAEQKRMQRQQAINRQLNTLGAKTDRPTGVVKLTVEAGDDFKADPRAGLGISYVIADAQWTPAYDIRIADIDSPLRLFYKAQIQQNTGEEWKDVRLTLSTGNPAVDNSKPSLPTYYLTFNNYRTPAPAAQGMTNRGTLGGRVLDEQGEPLPGVSIVVKGTNTATVTDLNGQYSFTLPANAQTVTYSFIGYKTKELPITGSVMNVGMEEEAVLLEEVVVVGYGGAASNKKSAESYTRPEPKPQVPIAIVQQQVSTEFAIDLPYSIPADNQPRDVTMVEYGIPATYSYSCVPKFSPDVFLMAAIPDVAAYNLQNGEASLFFNGVYQGKTYIDANAMEDTLNVSVGRDKDVAVERKIRKDYQSRRFAGSSVREQKAWEITLRNNKSIPLRITVEDQYPVSKESDIRVEDLLHEGAKADADTGKLRWDVQMPAKSTEHLNFRYTVRYPKSRKVLVD